MKLLYVSAIYPGALATLEAERRGREAEPFEAQCAALERQAFGWAGAWGPALAPLGWEVLEAWLNAAPLQNAGARERGLPPGLGPGDIAVEQARAFAPDVMWFDHHDHALLARLNAATPGVLAVIGWAGSALTASPCWRDFDLVLSCAPESVEALRRGGARAELLPHAFNERVLEHLVSRPPLHDATFIGQLAADHPLHVHREQLLEDLLREIPLAIFAPRPERLSSAGAGARSLAWRVARVLRAAGVPDAALARIPGIGRTATWPAPPRGPLSDRLRRALRPPVFGLAFYQTLRDSRVTLNVHAGAATRFTSNMRLFEATGVGACLVTDHARNLGELFEEGREVVAFRDRGECRERVRWLLEHERERAEIAAAGQRRCLTGHTFARRAPQLDAALRSVLRGA
jgi:hypothetical protein